MALLGRVVTDYRVGLAGACLPIGKYSCVNTLHKLANRILNKQEHVLLRGLRGENIVELHVRVVAGTTNFEGVVLNVALLTSSRLTNMLGSYSLSTGRIRMIILSLSSHMGAWLALRGLLLFIRCRYKTKYSIISAVEITSTLYN